MVISTLLLVVRGRNGYGRGFSGIYEWS